MAEEHNGPFELWRYLAEASYRRAVNESDFQQRKREREAERLTAQAEYSAKYISRER